MNLQQLYYFKTIAKLEHYTKASQELMITQSSLSHSISDLENELNVKLFYREGRNVKLTKYGLFFLNYITKSLDILEEGKSKLKDFIDPDAGTIILNYASSLNNFIPYLVSKFYETTKTLQNKFLFYQSLTPEIKEQTLNGTIDLGFSTAFDDDELDYYKIGSHKTVLIVSKNHHLAKNNIVDLRNLSNEKFITFDYQCQIRYYIDNIFKEMNIKPKIILAGTSDNIILASVAANFGIALVPMPINIVPSNIKVLSIINDIPDREIYMIWAKNRYMSPAVNLFKNFVMEKGLIFDEYKNSN